MQQVLSHSARRAMAACLLGLMLAASAPGCGMFMRPTEPGVTGSHALPRPFKQMRAMRRERELQQELEKEKFPRAEQVGISPAKETKEKSAD